MSSNFKFVGVDVFVMQAEIPAFKVTDITGFELKGIANRGTRVWPAPTPKIAMTDVYCCRFMSKVSGEGDALTLLKEIEKLGFKWVHVEKLHELNGKAAYSSMQG